MDSKTHTLCRKKRPPKGRFLLLAERVGFEPTVRENRTPDFESGPFDHSGTSPELVSNFHLVALQATVHLI